MFIPNFIENIFLSRLILVSSKVILNIKIDVKNHKKINKHLNVLSNRQKGNELRSYKMEKR